MYVAKPNHKIMSPLSFSSPHSSRDSGLIVSGEGHGRAEDRSDRTEATSAFWLNKVPWREVMRMVLLTRV